MTFQADQQQGTVQTLQFDFSDTTTLQIDPYWSYPTVGYYGPYVWGPFTLVPARTFAVADLDGNGLNDIILFPTYYNVAVPVSPVVFLNEGGGKWDEKVISLSSITPQVVNSLSIFSWSGGTYLFAADQGWEQGAAGNATKNGAHDILLKWDSGTASFIDESALLPNNGLNFNHPSWGGHITAGAAYDILDPRLGGIQGSGNGLTWYEFTADGKVVDRTADLPAVIQYQDQNSGYGLYSTSPSYYVGSAAASDLNGDGRVDIVTGQYNPALNGKFYLSVWAQQSDGSFSATPVLIPAPSYVQDPANHMNGAVQIVASDIEGTGRPDLIVLWESGTGQYVQILHNNGGLSFTDVTAQFFPQGSLARNAATPDSAGFFPATIGKITLEDVNGDGRPDLVLGDQSVALSEASSASQDFIYINEGGKYFQAQPFANLSNAQISSLSQSSTITGSNFNLPILADVTGDGIPDLVSITAAEGQPTTQNGLDFAPYYQLTVSSGALIAAQHPSWSQSSMAAAAGSQVLSLFGPQLAASRAQSFTTIVSITAYAQIPTGHDDFTVSINGTKVGAATFAANATGEYVDSSGTAWTTETVSFALSGLTSISSLSLGIDTTTQIKAVDVNGVSLSVGSGFSNPGSVVTLDASPWNSGLAAALKIGSAAEPIVVTGGGGTDIVEVLGSPADYTISGVGTATVTLTENSGLGQNASLSGISALDFYDGARLDLATGLWTVKADAADMAAGLDMFRGWAAKGTLTSAALTGTVSVLSVSATQLVSDAAVLKEITGVSSLTITAPASNATIANESGNAASLVFAGTGNQYTIAPAGDGTSFTISGNGITDHVSGVQALQFSDYTDIVAAQPGKAAVTSGNITELYGAVFGRTPDIGGLSFYQNFLAKTPGTGLTQFALWFLSSSEYQNNPAHNYAQTVTGDQQFITDSYQNLLHRAPSSDEVAYYENNVIAKALVNLTPGTAAYAAADAQAHALTLVFFSQSPEFLGDVQVTAQNPTSSQHWLVLI